MFAKTFTSSLRSTAALYRSGGLVILITLLLAGCIKDHNPAPSYRYLVKAENIANVSAADVKLRAGQLAAFVQRGVTAYRLTYRTKGLDGTELLASGLVLFGEKASDSLSVISFQHGTITTNDEAPSEYKPVGNMEAYVAATLGASLAKGYYVVMPDYLGFGASKLLPHPYQHKASLASAGLDMLRAAKEFAMNQGLKIREGVRLTGYSEGGYATLAIHQALEQTAASEFKVLASYPAAGAYDMFETAKWVVSQNKVLPPQAALYYLWVLLTYNQLYAINAPLESMITPDNVLKVQAAIAQGNPLAAQVSQNPTELFTKEFRDGITNGTNTAFINALKMNNVYQWKPMAPVTYAHALGDDIVPVINSQIAVSTMQGLGAKVNFIPLGTATTTHREGTQPYLELIIQLLITL